VLTVRNKAPVEAARMYQWATVSELGTRSDVC